MALAETTSERAVQDSLPDEPAAAIRGRARLPPEERERLRAKLLSYSPRWYRAWAHVAVPALCGGALAITALLLLRDVRPLEWLAVPVAYLLLNAGEWHIHKQLLHHRTPPLQVLYDRHTPQHHMVFVTDDMAVRSTAELRLVLIPAWGIVAAFLTLLPLPLVAWALGRPNLGLLFFATAITYVLSYEWLHLAYHLPRSSFIGRLGLVARLRHHHATHHAPELMQRWNFNVTVPLWDLVRGTIYRLPSPRLPGDGEAPHS